MQYIGISSSWIRHYTLFTDTIMWGGCQGNGASTVGQERSKLTKIGRNIGCNLRVNERIFNSLCIFATIAKFQNRMTQRNGTFYDMEIIIVLIRYSLRDSKIKMNNFGISMLAQRIVKKNCKKSIKFFDSIFKSFSRLASCLLTKKQLLK